MQNSHNLFNNVECPVPSLIQDLINSDTEEKLKKIENIFLLDNVMYMKGIINLYKSSSAEKPIFQINAWSSFSQKTFLSNLEKFKQGKPIVLKSSLENQIPFFPNTYGLIVETHLQIDYEYSVINFQDDSPLKSHQNSFSEKKLTKLIHDLDTNIYSQYHIS